MAARFPLLPLFLPAWLAFLFYLPTLAHGYVWDDTYFLRDLPYLRDPALWWQALQEPLFVSRNYFRPLPLLMFVAEAGFGGGLALIHHAVNVFLHMVNTILVVSLARNILPADVRGRWLAAAAGVLFALHPALVENVSWISDRFDLLMASFILFALWAECRVQTEWARLALQAACFLGALLSKETGVVLLPLLVLWQCYLLMREGRGWSEVACALMRRWRLWGMLLLALGVYLALRYAAFGFLYRSNSSLMAGDLLQHVLLIGKTLGTYLVLLVFPFGQIAPVHPALTPLAHDDAGAWLGLAAITALILSMAWLAARRKPLAIIALMALVALGPVSNLLPLTTGDNIVHDRYLLLSVAFVSLALICILYDSTQRWTVPATLAWSVAAAVTVVLAVPHWESDNTLWAWAYAKHPDSQIAGENYMTVLVNTSRDEEALALTAHFVRVGNWMQQGSAHYLRAFVFRRQGRLAEAEAEIVRALELPRRDDALGEYLTSEKLNVLARIQIEQGRYSPARENLKSSLELTPHMARTYYLLALWHYRQRMLADGDAALAQASRYALKGQADIFRRELELERQRAGG